MTFSKIAVFTASIFLFFTSCSEDDELLPLPLGAYEKGVLVLNEGNFGQPNSSLSYISNDLSTFQNNVFSIVNPTLTLGDTGQDLAFNGNLAYVVMNNSNKIEVVNRFTLKSIGTILTGLSNPRYIAFYNGKGYVTNWGNPGNTSDDYVAIINLSSNTVTSTIPVVEGPEKVLVVNNTIYVAHKGGFGFGNKVSVISPTTNAVLSEIAVGDLPSSLIESNGSLYVLCSGIPSWSTTPAETGGKLVKINLATNAVSSTLDFQVNEHPQNLNISGTSFYYTVDKKIFSMSVGVTSLPTAPLFTTAAQGAYGIYGFAVGNDKIYVSDAKDYSSNGEVYVYNKTGILQKSYTVGVIPSGFYFNN